MRHFFLLLISALTISVCQAQNNDTITVSSKKEESNRNVMLNAQNSNKPRDISIGLPASAGGTEIYEDGIPVGQYYWPVMHYYHWAGGNSYSSQGLMKVGENAISSGNVGYAINSFTQLGADEFKGKADFTTNQFGLLKFDGNINGPLKKGFYYTLGANVNLDPTSVKNPSLTFVERTQIYKVGLTKRWNDDKGEVSFLYKFSMSSQSLNGYNSGPFYYVGDGSIESYKDFRLGNDSYMPDDDHVSYMDLRDGKIHTNRLRNMYGRTTHDMMLNFKYSFDNSLRLEINTRLGLAPDANNTIIKDSGIDEASVISGYSFVDGSLFTGIFQRRLNLFFETSSRDIMATAQLIKNMTNHEIRFGINTWYNYQNVGASTFIMAHTVDANPVRVYYNNNDTWSYNDCAEYYEGSETKLAAFVTDDWTPGNRFYLYYGLRLEYDKLDIINASNTSDNVNNNRYDGFSLKDAGITKNSYEKGFFNPTAMINTSYRITGSLSLAGEYLFSRRRVRLDNFCSASLPEEEPIDTQMERFGITYDNRWLQLTTMASYIYNSNNKQTTHFTKTINGASETQAKTIAYDIATIGWTTDAVIKPFDGFSLHLLATLQNPRYKDFDIDITYSDGSSESLSYSNKYVSGISKVLLEIDPSYEVKKWNFWLSLRYYSKQYANKMNNVCFNGHWETFGGIGYKVLDKLSMNLNVVNIFNQSGANGSIASADLFSDASVLNNYLISGTYIRPFTIEFAVKFEF